MALAELSARPTSARRCRLAALLLILAAGALHLAYLLHDCPLDLAPDEAHYWDWSRHPDWSYYSKGPLVAWLIRGSCALFGPLAERLTGSQMPAVRLPAVLCGCLLLASLYALTVQVYRRPGLALAVVALALTLPVIAAGSSLMTIDAPYTCLWGWALVAGHRAVFRGSGWAWPAAGLLVGLGILAKYTMVLWLPSLGLFLLATPGCRRVLFRPGFWTITAVAAVCCVPILVWNGQHDWATLRHVGGQAGLRHPAGLRWWGPLSYLGTQAALLLGFWFVAWVAAMWANRPGRASEMGVGYLWWMSAPMFVFFGVFSLKTAEEPNWPITAYLSGLVLTVAWVDRQVRSPQIGYRRLARGCLAAACVLGLTLTLVMHRSDLARPVLLRLSGPPRPDRPYPLRRLDPTCRLKGWRLLAEKVDRVRERLRQEGVEPLLAGGSWTLPGELAFYCNGHPTVYSLGPALGDRRSQYDLWRPNPVWDANRFIGRTMIFVGEVTPRLREAFRNVERSREVVYAEYGQPIARWTVMVCRGFRGFGKVEGSGEW